MAMAMDSESESDLKYLTDCMFFINGHCKLNDQCQYRHCREAVEQIQNCTKWPKTCRNVTCPYRHPEIASKAPKKKTQIPEAIVNHPCQPHPPALPLMRQEGFISFFWDIENVPIPRRQKPFDIVQRIRQQLVIERGLQEVDFSCYCDINTISKQNQKSLDHAAVRIVHVPDRKSNAADRKILLDLDRFERVHRPPATIVLISGDIDFVCKLSDLRHQARFHVIVIHNKPAKQELKATVNECYSWELFTLQQQPINVANGFDSIENERTVQAEQPNRMRQSSSSSSLRRIDPSPNQLFSPNQQQPIVTTHDIKKYQCPICINEFESTQSLRQHQNIKNHLFKCPVCNESFITKADQTQHKKDKNHHVLDYKCNQCNRPFAKIESLNQHQLTTGHASSFIRPPDHNKLMHQQTLPPLLPLNDQDPMIIILQGIEAIKQYYTKRFQRNN